MIRKCTEADFEAVYEIINDAAEAYRGIIPADRWHEPYMSREQLKQEIDAGVSFWGFEEDGTLIGVMGIQDKGDVTLIRHAYVKSRMRNRGIGSRLLQFLEATTEKPILIGMWADATWAVAFYQKYGYRLVSTEEKNQLLKKYWYIPERQVETSVVLAGKKWNSPTTNGTLTRPSRQTHSKHRATDAHHQVAILKEDIMKILKYSDVKPTHFESDEAKGIAARVVIGKKDGANNFCMRVFEISAGGNTPKHSHNWEHEMFIHSGEGEIYGNGQWNPVKSGNAIFVPSNEEHQIRNRSKKLLVVVCLIPSKAPEL